MCLGRTFLGLSVQDLGYVVHENGFYWWNPIPHAMHFLLHTVGYDQLGLSFVDCGPRTDTRDMRITEEPT